MVEGKERKLLIYWYFLDHKYNQAAFKKQSLNSNWLYITIDLKTFLIQSEKVK